MPTPSSKLGEILKKISITELLYATFFALTVALVISTVRQYLRLRQIKGPRVAGFSNWWILRHLRGGRNHLDLYDVCQKYGPTARIGPNTLVTSDPDLVKRIFNVRSGYRRAYWYYAMQLNPGQDNILSLRDDQQHNKLRAKLAHGYSGKEVENLEPIIDHNLRELIARLNSYIDQDETFDFARKISYFTLDVIFHLAFGQPVGFIAEDRDVYDYCKMLEEQMPNILLTTVYPWILNVLQWRVMKSLLPSDKDPIGFGKIIGLAKSVAATRYAPKAPDYRDMLGSFKAHGLTHTEAESEILVQIIAGSDTTATALRTTVLYVMSNGHVLEKLRREIETVYEKKREDVGGEDGVISDAQARKMPYLQAIIKEGLRIHPPVTGLMAKEVPPGGDEWKGLHLPGGTDIGLCMWGIMRWPEIWGDDAAEFRPERWLASSRETLGKMEATLDLVFSGGRWQCLGRNVALIELGKVLVELFRRFDFAVVDPTGLAWRSFNAGIFLQRDFWVRAYRRDDA